MINSLLLAGLVSLASARRACDFNITADQASAHACGAECQATYEKTTQGHDLEFFGSDFDFGFYETAANFSGAQAGGELLKLAPVNASSLDVKPGTTVYRIQYSSVDYDGSLVPVTGYVAFPYAAPVQQQLTRNGGTAGGDGGGMNMNPPGSNNTNSNNNNNSTAAGRFRLAAWAHGTSGIYAGCAPSNSPTLYDPTAWQALLDQGYAVVGTDYAGIGNNYTTHKFLSFDVQATDVYYSTVAARKAFPGLLSEEWFGVGHSQGGGVVWKLAEGDYVKSSRHGADNRGSSSSSGYVGTVAIAPATYVVDMLLGGYDSLPYADFVPLLPELVRRVTPSYNGSTILTDQMESRMALAEEAQMCVGGTLGMVADLSKGQILSRERLARDWPVYLAWQARTAPALAGARTSAPMLVVQGANDTTVLPATTAEAVERACEAGNEVHLSVYPGMGHSPVVAASLSEWVPWINARFDEAQGVKGREKAERDGNGKCTKRVREPFDLDNMVVKTPGEL
ncbi:hypothetical protein JDV02_010595 [Purpureocillium takamizusanense]|uniref:Serine aminopeptidase S33 domain-containing protein n=1 Tax=Purpureocillium takamizusanense TaxID=2060973 RepID=A0A9Q8VGR5_9HYPO|nr:uncharacterized protein JDV02_010595 [Purpureocillium takamizusanense]UNI24876.1 hypothetical protein JDV02_010595 [Purpureocillium takamizusanense]